MAETHQTANGHPQSPVLRTDDDPLSGRPTETIEGYTSCSAVEALTRLAASFERAVRPDHLDRLVYDKVRTDVLAIARNSRGQETAAVQAAVSSVERLERVLANPGMWSGSADPVLRMCLAARLGSVSGRQRWEDEALRAYLALPDDYDELLCDLIPADFLERANAALAVRAYDSGTNQTAADDWAVYTDRRQARDEATTRAVTTGIGGLDAQLGGGLRGLTFLGGVTNIGKSSLAINVIRAGGRTCPTLGFLFVQIDMTKEAVYDMLLAAETAEAAGSGVGAGAPSDPSPRSAARPGDPPEYLRRLRVLDRRNFIDLRYAENWADSLVDLLLGAIRGLREEIGGETVLMILDNFQRLDVPGIGNDLERDVSRLDVLARVQAATASAVHPGGVPILALSKIPKGRGPSGLGPDDLFGDSDLASRASAILFLEPDVERPPTEPDVQPLVVNLAKGRDGTTRGRLPVDFLYRAYTFREPPARAVSHVVPDGRSSRTRTAPAGGGRAYNRGKVVE